jgi:hypothetical protein
MELRSQNFQAFGPAHPNAPCAQCGRTLFGPDWSERLDDCRIRHLWCCTACDYQFETLVCYPVAKAQPD